MIDTKGIFSILQLLYAVSDPTLRKGELETFVSIAKKKWIDLNNDGKEDFTALINQNCTSDPVELFLLCSLGDGFVAQTLRTERARMDSTVLDLNGDGVYELCLNESILGDTPHVLVVYWVNVHAWNGQAYVKSNEQFVESFYRRRYLSQLSERLHDAGKRLNWGESRPTIVSVLEDCRTALARVSALQNPEKRQDSLTDRHHLIEPEKVHRDLSQISEQIAHAQELLRSGEEHEVITSVLEKSHKALNSVSTLPNEGTRITE
jgi:hypothetical protein